MPCGYLPMSTTLTDAELTNGTSLSLANPTAMTTCNAEVTGLATETSPTVLVPARANTTAKESTIEISPTYTYIQHASEHNS